MGSSPAGRTMIYDVVDDFLDEDGLGSDRGYRYFCDPYHPLANKSSKVYYHRYVMSVKLGRWILSEEHVHHIDGDKSNNDPDNLMLVSASEHAALEAKNRGYPVKEIHPCEFCGEQTINKRFCSSECSSICSRRAERPTRDVLEREISEYSWVALGKKYGVSDKAVVKWARSYGIL